MTWQEELRQLDSALAGGELSANEYRKRRDEILAAASSAQTPSPVIGPPTGPNPVVAPPAPPPAAAAPDAPDPAEVTQVVNVVSAEPEADVTQIITDPAKPPNNGASAMPPPVPSADEATSPAIQPPQGQWSTLPPTHNSATNIGTFPPVPPQAIGPAPTPLDAQDLFTGNKPAAGGKKPWLIPVAVLVVLAIAGGAVWFFAFRDTGSDSANPPASNTTTQQQTEQTQAAPEPVDVTKIVLPGEQASNSGEMDIARASELKVISAAEATLLGDAGADALTYSGYSDEGYRYLLYAYKSADAAAAEEFTGKVLDIQRQLGFTEANLDGMPAGVTVMQVANEKAAAVRGVYTYGDVTIQLSVLQIPVGDSGQLTSQFQQAVTAVTDAATPPK